MSQVNQVGRCTDAEDAIVDQPQLYSELAKHMRRAEKLKQLPSRLVDLLTGYLAFE